jgi:cysteinyl-tRNA synthetase
VLSLNGYQVKHVMNITDVGHLVSDSDFGEDRMEKGSRRTGKSAWEIAELYTAAFREDMENLHIQEPTIWCKATDHIEEQIQTVKCIEEKGYTYRTSDGIYFDTAKLPEYGHLGRLDIDGLRAGARVEQGEKRNITDFALWKFSPSDEKRQMEWDSPWGTGFPGWHIECSAMSAKYLGSLFDIHCGGEDHITVHHPNEIAQTQACYGTRLANFWMHGYFLQIDSARMGKSMGNFLRVQSLIDEGYDPLAYRYMCLGAHYRSRLSFSWDTLASAQTALSRLRNLCYDLGESGLVDEDYMDRFVNEVNDDLNMPRALAVTWDLMRSTLANETKKATVLAFDHVLGLNLANWKPEQAVIPDEVMQYVQQRQQARSSKNWAEADALRDKIQNAGYQVKDTPDGPVVSKI